MAISSAIAIGAGVTSLVVGNQQKQKQKGDQAALQRDLESSIANAPKPPDTAKLNADAARQAAAASAAQRRAAPEGGFASTILTGGSGAPAVPTIKKTLLGQ
jgi:hypothetical protein